MQSNSDGCPWCPRVTPVFILPARMTNLPLKERFCHADGPVFLRTRFQLHVGKREKTANQLDGNISLSPHFSPGRKKRHHCMKIILNVSFFNRTAQGCALANASSGRVKSTPRWMWTKCYRPHPLNKSSGVMAHRSRIHDITQCLSHRVALGRSLNPNFVS